MSPIASTGSACSHRASLGRPRQSVAHTLLTTRLALLGARSSFLQPCRLPQHLQKFAVYATGSQGPAVSNAGTPASNSGTAGAAASPSPSVPPSATSSTLDAAGAIPQAQQPAFSLKPIYVLIFSLLFVGGLLFASMSLQLTSDLGFRDALMKVVRRVFRSIAFRQLVVITACMFLVRFALNNVLRFLARWSSSPVHWDKSKMYYVMKEVYSPLELLLFIAGCCTIADSFVPQLINVPKATVTHVVRAVLSMSFVIGAAVVVYNLKSRFCKEQAWQCEVQGDVTSQRRWEAYDKLGTFGIYVVGTVLVIQALGLEVRSVLAIGGIGGLAIGLAGREICENLLNGFLLMTTMPFEVGEEVLFRPNAQVVEGIVVDVGWYRTLIRSFEREMYVIPNAVFSKNTVLNITRKGREWRFYEFLNVRVQDVHKVNQIIQDIRRIVKNDARILTKLHRRVFMDKITLEDVKIYISFYVEASNRDAFMAVKQDLLLAFVDCIERNGAKLAQPRTVLEVDPTTGDMLLPRLMTGLLPGPGGSSAVYGGRGSSNLPYTVQVVDSVEVPATAVPVSGNGSLTSNGSGSNGTGSKGSSSGKGSTSSGSSSGAVSPSGRSFPTAAGNGGATADQQQRQQQQVAAATAAAPAAASMAYAAAGIGNHGVGRVVDAADMAAGSNAQRKGDCSTDVESCSELLYNLKPSGGSTSRSGSNSRGGTGSSSGSSNSSITSGLGKKGSSGGSSSSSGKGGSSGYSPSNSGSSSATGSSDNSGSSSGGASPLGSSSSSVASNVATYRVVSGPAAMAINTAQATAAPAGRPDTMTILASFEDCDQY